MLLSLLLPSNHINHLLFVFQYLYIFWPFLLKEKAISQKPVVYVRAASLQSCATLCDPMNYNSPGSPVHGALQAGLLEWVAMPHSSNLPDPGIKCVPLVAPALQADSLPLSHQGSPLLRLGSLISSKPYQGSLLMGCYYLTG